MNTPPPPPPTDAYQTTARPLYRPMKNRMIAGVAAGIAQYLDADVTVVRIVLAALTVFGGVGIALYIAGWLLMPHEGSEQSLAQKILHSAPLCEN
ncbi:MAG TPA: PspC domain-containing protein [Candidatus Dormibacteraeota bacterium]